MRWLIEYYDTMTEQNAVTEIQASSWRVALGKFDGRCSLLFGMTFPVMGGWEL
jgi:hypothetical protein